LTTDCGVDVVIHETLEEQAVFLATLSPHLDSGVGYKFSGMVEKRWAQRHGNVYHVHAHIDNYPPNMARDTLFWKRLK